MCFFVPKGMEYNRKQERFMFQLIYSPTGVSQSTAGSYFVTTPQGQCYHKHLKMSGKHTDSKIDTSDHLEEEDTYANEYSCTAPNEFSIVHS